MPLSSAICSVFGSRCPARSSSLAHPLLPGHVVGRRDDDVVGRRDDDVVVTGKLWIIMLMFMFCKTKYDSEPNFKFL